MPYSIDTLLAIPDFRAFAFDLANRAGMLAPECRQTSEWYAGYRAAYHDIVSGIVANAADGPAWLAEYARRRKEKKQENAHGSRNN